MDSQAKVCPKCNTQLRQGEGAFELVRKGAVSGSMPGRPVTIYVCSKCGYIELYDLRLLGHI